ncbi:MAG: hypothetical protein KBG15_07800 [Kofleriaceae bacterium]|nr:hypothetical protein [Kofleriaceae bacterium]
MTDTKYVACDEFYWLRRDGSKTRISWQSGTPYYSDGSWICSSYLDGVDDRAFKSYGASAMQALLFSAAFGFSKIMRLIQNGNMISGVDEEA